MTGRIPLKWVSLIEKRLKDSKNPNIIDDSFLAFENQPFIKEFIQPILEYGRAEEKRIWKAMEAKIKEER